MCMTCLLRVHGLPMCAKVAVACKGSEQCAHFCCMHMQSYSVVHMYLNLQIFQTTILTLKILNFKILQFQILNFKFLQFKHVVAQDCISNFRFLNLRISA